MFEDWDILFLMRFFFFFFNLKLVLTRLPRSVCLFVQKENTCMHGTIYMVTVPKIHIVLRRFTVYEILTHRTEPVDCADQ